MKRERLRALCRPVPGLAAALFLAAAGPAQAESCVTSECHATLLARSQVHAAAESCEDCHEAVATSHPQAGTKTFRLAAQPPELCANCHEVLGGQATVHEPVAGGECTTCHDPHASDQPQLLSQPLAELCANCHDVPGAVAHGHAPVRDGRCTACHRPHESDQAKLLRAPERELCLGCHRGVVTRAMTTVHPPAGEGCVECHQAHGGGRASFLVRDFPDGPYVPFTAAAFALCFECHDAGLVTDARTTAATGFRDGDRNLHAVHVGDPKKGRSCQLCHDLHGGADPRLVATQVPFGKWALPLRFVATANGGGCSPGCHRPASYDRVNPGRKTTPRSTTPRGD